MLSILSVVLLSLMPWANLDAAQDLADDRQLLGGLREMQVSVDERDRDEAACNVHNDSLILAAARPLVDAGIRVVDDGQVLTRVRLAVIETNVGCVGSVVVQFLIKDTTIQLPYGGTAIGDVELGSTGSVLTGAASNFGSRVNNEVRQFVEQFATRVKLANQK